MLKPICTTITLVLSLTTCAMAEPTDASNKSYSFGLWGDMPYKKAGDEAKLPAVLKSINDADIEFSMYDGDIKDGSSRCTDNIYTEALTMFNSMAKPVIYALGDNEWTDCHYTKNGGYDALERLDHLRKVMFATVNSLGQTTMPLEHQGAPGTKYSENTRFSYGPVVFSSFNMPGSNNNWVLSGYECSHKSARTPEQCDATNAEYRERDAANVTWLEESFKAAKAQKARGVVLVFQADPGFDLPETMDKDESQLPQFSGYRNFINQVVKQTENFDGQVLLVHGDTHFFKMDKPLYSPKRVLYNLTRLETFGSPVLNWVKVTVDTSTEALFIVQPMMVRQP